MIYKLAPNKTLEHLKYWGFVPTRKEGFILARGDDDCVGVEKDTYNIVASRDDSPTIESLLKLGIIEPKR